MLTINVLFLANDAYGGRGGIAYYNRCLAEALAEIPEIDRVTLLPRSLCDTADKMPPKVSLIGTAAGSKTRFVRTAAAQLFRPCDAVLCGHINLLPLAAALAFVKGVPLVLQVHGIEVWEARHAFVRAYMWACLKMVTAVWSVSGVTRDRMNAWAKLPISDYTIIPNTIHLERYGLAPESADLQKRFGVEGKKVILTLARLDRRERYKGIDEILECLPQLLQQAPTLAYLIAGCGDDQPRLTAKAQSLGVADRVCFIGHVPESDKADLLRLADVFAMPGRGEGFGIVYLEAMACGVPVVGSLLDGSREALRNGELGQLVNPDDSACLQRALLRALHIPKHIPAGLEHFAWSAFARRVNAAMTAILRKSAS